MSRKRYLFFVVVAFIVVGAMIFFYAGSRVPSGQPALARLTPDNLSQVQASFNAAKNDVRILVLLSPT